MGQKEPGEQAGAADSPVAGQKEPAGHGVGSIEPGGHELRAGHTRVAAERPEVGQ